MATALGSYATTANLKTRLGITDTTDDTLLGTICDQVNSYIEGYTGRVLAAIASTTYTFDGSDALEDGRCLVVGNLGVRAIGTLEVAPYTGAAFVSVPSSDYFIRPTVQKRSLQGEPGWEIWMTDIPSGTNPYPYFPPGFANVRINAAWGWSAIPDEITDLALTTATRMWHGRLSGQAEIVGNDALTGSPVVSRYLSARDLATLGRYRDKTPSII